jgi:hypothetical protein
MSSLKKYLLNLNLFKPSPGSGEQEDDQRRRSNIIATRVYILILIVTLFGIGLGLFLIDQTTIITIKNPTREQFEALPVDAQCSCSRISLPYGNFTSLQASFHQVCSSDFVTDRWFEAINFGANSTYFYLLDFRTYGSAQFQALAGLCRLSKASIEQSIAFFYLNTLLSPQVLSENVLRSQIQASIDQFQSTAPNTFKAQLRLVEEMIGHNRLQSGLQTNAIYKYYNNPSGLGIIITTAQLKQVDGSWCTCNIGNCNNGFSGIYNIFGAQTQLVVGNIQWLIPGISAGCLPVSSILVSTLECFYDQACLNKLISYFSTNENFTALTLVEQSHYSPNSTVQSIVDKLMLEDLMINISYDNYYSQCAPASCTYSKVSRHNFVFVLTKLIYVLAGLTLLLRLVIPPAIRFIQRLCNRTPRPRIPCKYNTIQLTPTLF